MDIYGCTLLHWAVLCSGPDIVKAIIDVGADVNAIARNGATVLMCALDSPNSALMCKMLIEAGAKVDLVAQKGDRSALHAAFYNVPIVPEIIKTLLRAGADANLISSGGFTPLHYAADFAFAEEIETLLAYGADIDAVSFHNERAIDFAIEGNNHEVLTTLLKYSACTDHHRKGQYGTYSSVIDAAASYGDVRTMRLLTEAQLTNIIMDDQAKRGYWYWFFTRPPPSFGEGDPLEALESAFKALLDSVTPRKVDQALLGTRESPYNGSLMPGAFPTHGSEDKADDLDDSDDDIEAATDVAAYSDEVRSLSSMSEVDQHTDGNEKIPTRNNDDQHRTIAETDGAVRSVESDNALEIEHPATSTLQPVGA